MGQTDTLFVFKNIFQKLKHLTYHKQILVDMRFTFLIRPIDFIVVITNQPS